jgi:hypothetical protein
MKKGTKNEHPGLGLPFSTLFWLFFSISCSLGALIVPQRSYTTSNVQKALGRFFLDFIHYLPNTKKGAKRGQKGRKKEQP